MAAMNNATQVEATLRRQQKVGAKQPGTKLVAGSPKDEAEIARIPYVKLILSKAAETYDVTMDRVQVTKVQVVGLVDRVQIKVFGYVATSDPKVQATAGGAAGGVVALGACGGAMGVATGGAIGAIAGVVPAFFTFGLSIPVGGLIGGSAGLCVGTTVGGGAGLVGGAGTGYGAYAYRKEIVQNWIIARTKALATYGSAKALALSTTQSVQTTTLSYANITKKKAVDTKGAVQARATSAALFSKAKALEASVGVKKTVSNPTVQATAGGAAAGAVAVGTAGGAVGLATGAAIGAALGVVPALFTFGLSIPVGAMIGGGTGLCIGAPIGGTVGAAGGGATGYGVYTKRAEISEAGSSALVKMHGCKGYVRDTARTGGSYVMAKLGSVKWTK